jgi:hypothetical protein
VQRRQLTNAPAIVTRESIDGNLASSSRRGRRLFSNVLGTAAPKSRVFSALKRDYFSKICGIEDRPQSPAFRYRERGEWAPF